ncbi:hypothetical protein SMD11_7049 [Streptomyces albireticuli]|uniref:Knr4/Smi1-like domain-containing protein n=1 Tax=Streptomyces albireticuli TaxID=1940 RepID=A0A1Z2LED1_9ACTN|nr:SMI1/KNR4 family protein [Streptomyces albireticuli]ARZ72625.1 hypothetical protein SMD11_7049 [Streptomyces albireticuli]
MDFLSFKDHLAVRAPLAAKALRMPASLADIQRLEADLGCELGTHLRNLLLSNDGAADDTGRFLPGGYRLLGCREIAEQHEMLCTVLDELGERMIGHWWHPQWVPFAIHVAANCLFVDMRDTDERGRVGEFLHDARAVGAWPNLPAMFAETSHALRSGTAVRDHVPVVVEGEITWE